MKITELMDATGRGVNSAVTFADLLALQPAPDAAEEAAAVAEAAETARRDRVAALRAQLAAEGE